ncbi:hypothetical protein LTS08_000956 [Lithohypha guttulata]|uniref:uncharacterized protein n=1 Tax=Lithohypha guttulata TaxID=1690604 RepID=UPI002DE0B6B1|nr:hypothetical protein LTR51_006431 [Lithohypha guttulata]KAK5106833.1 hypothetical protein LTS08_000956 [Lithohypha guttulata]
MDPFSGESELLNITTAFYTHAYNSVLDFDLSGLSNNNKPTAQTLKYRAQIALGQTSQVVSALSRSRDPGSRALVALAKNDLSTAQSLAEGSDNEDPTVQICAGTILANNGEYTQAVEVLSKHQGSLEAVALLTQIHLQNNRTDLALKEVAAAKRWAQDSLLINLAEAWTNLRVGGQEKYQSSYYVFEELASAPGNQSPTALVGQAVSEMHLGRVEEAEAALNQALESDNADIQAVANMLVLQYIMGRGNQDRANELRATLESRDSEHQLLSDLKEKEALFYTAAAKYSPKVAS